MGIVENLVLQNILNDAFELAAEKKFFFTSQATQKDEVRKHIY